MTILQKSKSKRLALLDCFLDSLDSFILSVVDLTGAFVQNVKKNKDGNIT